MPTERKIPVVDAVNVLICNHTSPDSARAGEEEKAKLPTQIPKPNVSNVMLTEGITKPEAGDLRALAQLAHVSEAVAAADTNYMTTEDRTQNNSAATPTIVDSKKKKRKLGRLPKSKDKNAKKIHNNRSFIDLANVPPQPLILKNKLICQGSSKYTGVYFDQENNKWKAQIMADGSVRSIGYYKKEEEAAADYARAAFKYKSKKVYKLYGGLDLSSVPEQPLIRNKTSASGYKGVKKMRGAWQARIRTGRSKETETTLGTFDAVEEAAGIYVRAVYYLEQMGGSKCPTATGPRDQGRCIGNAATENNKNDKSVSDGNPVDVTAGGSNCNPIKMAVSDRDVELVAV
mmetsp:Transcript_12586/g.23222  ORF Transcript_12586/g.23222 Transcript_12586/m.23222 type:complete len:345 (+) Transcript_12586:56-1090(+)